MNVLFLIGSDQQLEYIQALNTELEKLGYQMKKVGSGENVYMRWARIGEAQPDTSSVYLQAATAAQAEADAKKAAAQASQEKAIAEKADAQSTTASTQANEMAANQTKPTTKTTSPQTSPTPQANTQKPLPQSTTTAIAALPGASEESGVFSGLINTLEQDIPNAIQVKNNAFQNEANLVQSLATQEASAFNSLIGQLEKIAGLATNFKFQFSITGADQFNEEFLSNFDKLKVAIDGIDVSKFTALGQAFSGIGSSITGKKDISKYFTELATAVNSFSQSMGQISINDNFKSLSEMIERISNAGSALRDAATVFRNQAKVGYDYKYGIDKQSEQEAKDFLSEAKYLSNARNITNATKYRKAVDAYNAGDKTQGITAEQFVWLEEYEKRLRAFGEAYKSIMSEIESSSGQFISRLTPDGIKAIEDAWMNLALTGVKVGEGFKMESDKIIDYSEKLKVEQEKIDLIPQQEQSEYGHRIGMLQSQFNQEAQLLEQNDINWGQFVQRMKAHWKEYNDYKKANPFGSVNILNGVSGSTEDVRQQIQGALAQRYKVVTQNVSGGTIDSSGLGHFSAQVVDAQNNVQNLNIIWDRLNQSINATMSTAPDQFKGRFLGLISELQAKSKQLFVYWTATFMNPYRLIGTFKQVINIVKQYDDAFTEMRKVSDESVSTLREFQKASFDIANSLGTTGLQIQKSTADWLRLGETMDEAKKSAEVSNLLLNVSEFQNIDNATQALVSASQAYDDLEKIDIVDKLNNIGNNFSISTDQLAEGLQNSAAVLKTSGNDIDQALAILTAGNAITQDIGKTAAGVRTISLRIAGTKEAKEQLEELGEDTSDFVVQTESKVDAQVRKYTRTASNPNGVSVLDSNGRLRDTYDILLDIAKIYDEIVAKDDQMGTNTSNALLELLAGKTRSNILASILQNPEILEDVYKSSQNSSGSAMEENEKYLDSISGKLQQTTNELQKLANIVIDSEGLKVILDIINNILTSVTKLTDQFGGLNVLIGSIAGIALQKKGLGANNWNSLLSGMFVGKPSTQVINKTIVKPLSNFTQDAFSKIDLEGNNFFSQLTDIGVDEQAIRASGDSSLIALFDEVSQSEKGIISTREAYNTLGTSVVKVNQTVQQAPSVFSKLNGVLSTIGSTFITMAASMAAMFVISEIIKLIYDLITAQQRAIDAGKEAQKNISETAKGYRETVSSISEIKDEFAELSTGVDLNGNNVSLSTDEYDRFLELSKQIADIAPELVTGYDNQGNAIVALGNNVTDVNEKFQEYLNLQRDILNADIGSNLDVVWKGISNQVDKYSTKLIQANADYENSIASFEQGNADISNSVIGAFRAGLERQEGGVSKDTRYLQIHKDKADSFTQQAFLKGLSVENIGEVEGSPDVVRFAIPDLSYVDDETLRMLESFVNASTMTALKDAKLSDAQVKKYELLIDTEYKKIIPAITDYINTTPFFDQIDDEELQEKFKNGIIGIFSNLDSKQIAEYIESYGSVDAFVDDFIFTMTSNEETQSAFEGLLNLAEKQGEMTSKEITQARQEYYKIIMDAYKGENGESLYTEEYLNGFFGDSEYSDRLVKAKNKFGLTGPAFNEWFNEAKRSNAEAALTAIEQMSKSEAEKFVNDQEALYEYLLPYLNGEKPEVKAKPTGTLSDVINDESYKETAETASSHLSTLTGALETLRTEGHLTAETMVELQNAFPDLTEFTTESLNTKAFEELDTWIKTIREHMDEMTPEAREQAQTLIRNMVDQYGDLGLSINDIADTYYESLGIEKSQIGTTGIGTQFYSQVEDLRSKLAEEGIELDTHVLYTLVAQDEFSGAADQILEKYKDNAIVWDIVLDNQQLEKDITKEQAIVENAQAIRSRKEANGEIIFSDDYNIEVDSLKEIAKKRHEEAANAAKYYVQASDEDKDSAYTAYINALTAAYNADSDAANAAKEQVESGANLRLKELNDSNNAISAAQNKIAEAEKNGGKASQEMYNAIVSEQEKQANINRWLGDFYQGLANDAEKTGNEQWKSDWQEQANNYYAAAIQNESDAMEQRRIPLQNELNELQNESNEIQRDITKAEQKNQKVSKQTYRDLLANGQKQIRNLRQQQDGVDDFSEEWWNLQNDIESVQDSMFEWGQSLDRIVYDQAAALADAINTAMSESASGTGLTSETINALITGFSDLSGKQFDLSDMFYNTADGVKVNTEALRELTQAEFDMISANLADEIQTIQDKMKNTTDQTVWNSYNEQLQTLMQTQAQYFAQYEEMQKALSYNNAIEIAEGTADKGENYDNNYARLKTFKEDYENGKVGTDQFKAFTAYGDMFGRNTYEAFEAILPKFERYFTEDATEGVENFLKDLQAKGLAEYSDAEGWNMLFENEEDAARAMGMGPEFFNDMLGKIQDLGGYYAKVGSLTEYELNKQDLNSQLESALQTYIKMQQSGKATTDELKAQEEVIQSIRDQLGDNETNRENYLKDQEEKRKADFEGIQDNLKMYQDLYDKATSDEERDAIRKMAQKEVAQYGYDLKEGEIALSEKAQEDYESRFKQGSIENPLTAKQMGIEKGNGDRKQYQSIVDSIQNQWGKNQDLSNLIQSISGMSADELKAIGHADGEWSKGEKTLEEICDTLDVSYENADLLVDALAGLGLIEFPGVLDEIPDELASGKEQLEGLLAVAEKGSGAKYQIELEPDYSQMTPDQLRTQLSEIEQFRTQISPDDTEMNAYLDELEENANIQLDIQAKLGAGDFTLPEIKRLIDTGDDEGLAAELGIDMTQEGATDQLERYKRMLQSMPQSYDMVVHIDDSQFQQLVDTVTGTPLDAEITANTDEAEGIWGKFKKAVEGNPIVQTITQFFTGNKETQKPQQTQTTTTTATATVGANTSSGNKDVEKFEKNVENVNKTTGTATVQVNTDQANAKINAFRNNLLLLNQLVVAPQFNESAIERAITRADILIQKLQRAQQLKQSSAIGTAHARGTALSHSYAGGTQDWTVGEDESALVNEIGQESIVRDGVWQLIPGGPHVEDLQRDDIIFNAEQTADLIRTGKTARSGRLVSYANGTVPGMSAFDAGLLNYKSRKKKSSGGGKNNGGGGNNGKKNKGNGKGKKTTNLDRFNKWLGKLFDWIEVRLDHIQRRIDLATAKAENAIGNIADGVEKIGTISENKNKNINDAMRNISTVNGNEQYEFTKSSAKTTDGVQRITGVKYSNIGSSDTLINNNLRGANRYFAEAEKVAKKATSGKTKIISASKANDIIAKIQSGQINIAEYTEKERAFIDAYKQWYDKAMDCVQAVEDLKSQLKELQQTKLDNITDEFDTLVGYADAVKASSEATVDYYNSAGFAKNTPTDRAEITKQQNRQNEITGLLIQEISAYKGELINAEKVFGKNSNEYHEAQTKLEDINKSLIESQKTERELAHAGYDLSKTVRGYFIDRVKTLVGKLSDIASLSEKRGTTQRYGINIAQIEDPYFEQTKYNNELILKYYEDIKEAQQEIAKEGAQINSERYEELYKTITDGESAITSLLSANEDLKDSIRTLRWKGYNEFQKQLDTINSDFEHLQGFIRDGDVLDNDAQFTDLGFAQIALIGEQMDTAEKKIRNAQGAIAKLDEEYQKHTINLEKYNEELDAQIDIIQDASGAIFDYQQKLADMYIDQITAENDALQDLIKARQDALSAKKEYYDYDKTLKSKNKDIAQLQAQINALQGVTNDAGKARRAQLEAELAEKQEDLNDTLYDHSIDLQQEGYDKLSEDMQTALDNAVKLIRGDQKVLQQTAALMLHQLETNDVDEAKIINGIVGDNATTLHSSTNAVINELSGEGGIKKLLEGIGVKLGDIASLDIAGAINSRKLDASVSKIDTAISIVKDSLGKDISGQLKNIETAIGTLTVRKQEKQGDEQEKQGAEQGNLSNGETAKGDKGIAGDVKSPTPLITKDDVSTDMSRVVSDPTVSGQTTDETKDQSDLNALAKEKNATLAEDSVMAAIRTGKQRSTKITDAEKKSHVPLWEYIVKNFGYAPNSTTYKKLAGALGVSVKNKNKITKKEKNKILKKLKAYVKKYFALAMKQISSGASASFSVAPGLEGLKSGTKKIDEDLLAWTNENWDKNGSEMIIRAKDNAILTPLKAKDAVIPANLADNLFKWGAVSPDKFVTNPFMGKWSADGGSTTNTDADYSSAAQTIEMHFDSLFHIDGNVDESVMPRLESLGKSLVNDRDFQKNVIKFVTKDFVRESKKQGIR